MNKTLLIALSLCLPGGAMMAQSAVDAYSISRGGDLRGTARFMSMGGAFTALGGDISTLNQNPGGIGLYRSSDLSLTLDLEAQSFKSSVGNISDKSSQTKFNVNNFGYIGAVNTGSEAMPYFNWGVSYSKVASFDRVYGGRLGYLGTSFTNMVADYTTFEGYTTEDLTMSNAYNPYYDSAAPWNSILMFDGFGINPTNPGAGNSQYVGMFNYDDKGNPITFGEGWYDIQEKGRIDEYAINFGGNIMNLVYWGIGFGITDIDFKQYAYYAEQFSSANVPALNENHTADGYNFSYYPGNANSPAQGGDYGLTNYKHIWGSGFNFKAGVIIKPINEFRIGLAVHTPTYYNLSYEGNATMAFGYNSPLYSEKENKMFNDGSTSTDWSDFDWKLQSPWRFMVGAAGVIGGRAIISADYEYRAYNNMKVKDWEGYEYSNINDDIKTYYQSTNILRLGAEYRVTPQFSLRAGYSYESSPIKSEVLDQTESDVLSVYTSGPNDMGTQPSYTLDRTTNYVTFGLGYKYKNFYADLAYVYRHRKSDYHAFTNYVENLPSVAPNGETYYPVVMAPSASISDSNNQIVLTMGVRF